MTPPLNSLGPLLANISIKAEEKSLPKVRASPPSERTKVAVQDSRFTKPIDKSAALLLCRSPWIYHAPRERPSENQCEAVNSLKTERNKSAILSNRIGLLKDELKRTRNQYSMILIENRMLKDQLRCAENEILKLTERLNVALKLI